MNPMMTIIQDQAGNTTRVTRNDRGHYEVTGQGRRLEYGSVESAHAEAHARLSVEAQERQLHAWDGLLPEAP